MTELANILNQDSKNEGTFALYIMNTFRHVNGEEFSNSEAMGFCMELKSKLDLIMFDLTEPHPEQKERPDPYATGNWID